MILSFNNQHAITLHDLYPHQNNNTSKTYKRPDKFDKPKNLLHFFEHKKISQTLSKKTRSTRINCCIF